MLMKPLPLALTRPVSFLIMAAWVGVMGLLVQRSYVQASSTNLATDLARYGSAAVWRGIYYRGEKIGFTVSQTVPTDEGFELQEDGRLQMTLLGAASAATLHTVARVDRAFALRSFEFSLDPGTGATRVSGTVEGGSTKASAAEGSSVEGGGTGDTADSGRVRLVLVVTTVSGTRTETRELAERPVLSLNMSRQLANGRLKPGAAHRFAIFDPATLQNTPVTIRVGNREIVRANDRPVPAFRVELAYHGLQSTSWVTDTGEIVREESPLGLMTVQESPERAKQLAISGGMQRDLLNASAIVPDKARRIDEPRDVRRMVLRLDGVDLSALDLQGVGQALTGSTLEIRDPRDLRASPLEADVERYLAPETLLESDAPEIMAEARLALRGVQPGARVRAEALTRYVNALLEKKPTVSLPSAREVLRTKVGDCNEHTALYVAMARAAGIPARIAVGLVYIRGAFYYHAWPEVYLTEPGPSTPLRAGYWLPVDPTLNQFPADGTHVRLARGGLEQQAKILPLINRLKIAMVDVELEANAEPILVGRETTDLGTLPATTPDTTPATASASSGTCRCANRSAASTDMVSGISEVATR